MTLDSFQLGSFSGSLAELVTEVRRRTIDILLVPLARVTRHFRDALRDPEPVDAIALAEFCDDSSVLLLAKSRALLPRERQREDEDVDPDPGLLEARLQAYRRLKHAAETLQHREARGLRAYTRTAPPPIAPELAAPPGDLGPEDLAAAFRAAIAALPAPDEVPSEAVRPHRVRIGDRLASIRAILRSRGRITFVEALTGGPNTREFVIVSFLAVLELLRRSAIRVTQDQLFGDIVLEVRSESALESADETAGTFLDEE